ncbi:hypothetical protein C2S51_020228 [Perilla frutescens var. frutescens]|nr:hypothetical protein C2S51_020228 [Perilla frutescens var. frutescens]
MSLIHEKSPKHCAEKQAILKLEKLKKKKKKKVLFYVSTLILSILSLILLVWFILHPRNPNFSLKQANIINNLHLNSSINITLTLLSTNPNNKVGIYYHRFLVHASYNGRVITPHTSMPPFYQDHEETKLLSTSLPVFDPSLPPATGEVAIDFKVTGRLSWRLGNYWVSRRYRFNVDCATVMAFGANASTPLGSHQATHCSTSIN